MEPSEEQSVTELVRGILGPLWKQIVEYMSGSENVLLSQLSPEFWITKIFPHLDETQLGALAGTTTWLNNLVVAYRRTLHLLDDGSFPLDEKGFANAHTLDQLQRILQQIAKGIHSYPNIGVHFLIWDGDPAMLKLQALLGNETVTHLTLSHGATLGALSKGRVSLFGGNIHTVNGGSVELNSGHIDTVVNAFQVIVFGGTIGDVFGGRFDLFGGEIGVGMSGVVAGSLQVLADDVTIYLGADFVKEDNWIFLQGETSDASSLQVFGFVNYPGCRVLPKDQ